MSDREPKSSDLSLKSLKSRFNLANRKRKPRSKWFIALPATASGDESLKALGIGALDQTPQTLGSHGIVHPSRAVDYSRERVAYARFKSSLTEEQPGKFVVFVGEEMIGPYDSLPAAVIAARQQFGRRPIYTKELVYDDSVR